jgi:hypothetical protein
MTATSGVEFMVTREDLLTFLDQMDSLCTELEHMGRNGKRQARQLREATDELADRLSARRLV